MLQQKTIKKVIHTVGVGLHSGQRVEITLKPGLPNTGIVFRRIDIRDSNDIHVSAQAVTDTRLASTISFNDIKVQTVEHLMSACAGLEIDNLYVELTGEEIPILDGSSSTFVFLLKRAGIEIQKAPREFMRVTTPIMVTEGDGASLKWARLEPYNGFKLNFEINFAHSAVDATGQIADFEMGRDLYERDIARARTFCFTKDVEMMRGLGLALGGGLDNAIVMDDYKVINSEGLRYRDEFVKHKMLDAMGDLYLLGRPLLASYSAYRSGHDLNNKLLRALLEQEDAFEYVTIDEKGDIPSGYGQFMNAF